MPKTIWMTIDLKSSHFYFVFKIEIRIGLSQTLFLKKSEKFKFPKNFAIIFEKFSKFDKFLIFRGNLPLWSLELLSAIFEKLHGRKISEFCFWGQFCTLKIIATKFFGNSNFSDFLGIKSEINQCSKWIWFKWIWNGTHPRIFQKYFTRQQYWLL